MVLYIPEYNDQILSLFKSADFTPKETLSNWLLNELIVLFCPVIVFVNLTPSVPTQVPHISDKHALAGDNIDILILLLHCWSFVITGVNPTPSLHSIKY